MKIKAVFCGRRGSSLVEVIAAVMVLAIVIIAVIGSLGLSQRSLVGTNDEDGNAAAAQAIVDTLIQELSAASAPSDDTMEAACGAVKADSADFDPANGERQFFVESDGADGYYITAGVFSGGGQCVTLRGYASMYGGAFLPEGVSSQPGS